MRRSIVALAGLAWCAFAQAAPVQVVDDRGLAVKLDAPPRRIVSMLPSLTETVCALDACDRLVGVDRYSNAPAQVRAIATLGGLDDANVEAIVALKPDVVLLAQSSRVIERLSALGLRTVVMEPRTYAETERAIVRLAALLDRPAQGQKIWQRLVDNVNESRRQIPPPWAGAKVYYEVDAAPFAASAGSFIGETLERLNLKNMVPADWGPFPKINPEYVVHADPDVIMLGDRASPDELAQRPGWSRLRAVRSQHVCRFEPHERDALARAGPRLGDGAAAIARCLKGLPR